MQINFHQRITARARYVWKRPKDINMVLCSLSSIQILCSTWPMKLWYLSCNNDRDRGCVPRLCRATFSLKWLKSDVLSRRCRWGKSASPVNLQIEASYSVESHAGDMLSFNELAIACVNENAPVYECWYAIEMYCIWGLCLWDVEIAYCFAHQQPEGKVTHT